MRPGPVAFGIGVLGLGTWLVLAIVGVPAMPSYLAAWFAWMALPAGALPLAMLLELLGVRGWALLPVLRRMLLLLPVGAVFAVPVMLAAGTLYPAAGFAVPFFARMILVLAVWLLLAFVFCRPPRGEPRRGWAAIGLMLHLVAGSVAAVDWVMALQPGLGSSVFGLLVIVAQMGAALSAAVFVIAVSTRHGLLPTETRSAMAAFLAVWLFLHFTQYLVIWSANLPGEIVWYQHRGGAWGGALVWSVVAASVLTFAVLMFDAGRIPWVMASIAAMVLLAHVLEAGWLVTPALRGAFTLAWADLPALLGFGGLAAGLVWALKPEAAHGPA